MSRSMVLATVAVSMLSATARAEVINLSDAMRRADQRPEVAVVRAEVAAALGDADQAGRPLYNPELGAAAGPRLGGGNTRVEVELSLSQVFELGGKRAARRDAASAQAAVVRARLDAVRRLAQLKVWQAYNLALAAQARVAAASDVEQLAQQLSDATATRLGLGDDTLLQVNLTAAELGRARHERLDAETSYESAITELGRTVGAPAQDRVEPAGELPTLAELPWSESDFAARAAADRPELTAARAAITAAKAEVRLADALGTPDLGLGISYGLESDPDTTNHVLLFGATVTLPVRNRNQGGRAAARARERGVTIDAARVTVDVEREARLAWRTHQRALAAVRGYDLEVNARLKENLDLARQSFEAGKIDYFEFNLVRRELIASRAAYLDAMAEAIVAHAAIVRAVGGEDLR